MFLQDVSFQLGTWEKGGMARKGGMVRSCSGQGDESRERNSYHDNYTEKERRSEGTRSVNAKARGVCDNPNSDQLSIMRCAFNELLRVTARLGCLDFVIIPEYQVGSTKYLHDGIVY